MQISRGISAFLAVNIILLANAAAMVAQGTEMTYESLLKRLDTLGVDSASHRKVEGLFFEDGLYSISLDSGSIVMLEPVDGRRIAAIFRGTCNVSFTPNHPTEQVNLSRFTGATAYSKSCTSAVFVFGDQRLVSLIEEFPTSPIGNLVLTKHLSTVRRMMVYDEPKQISPALARLILNRDTLPFMRINAYDVSITVGEIDCYVSRNPYEMEPFKLTIKDTKNGPKELTSVNLCPDDSRTVEVDADGSTSLDDVSTQRHIATCMIDRSLDLRVVDNIEMTARRDGLRWLEMEVTSIVKVDSVFIDGEKTVFFRAKDESSFFVQFPKPLPKGQAFTMRVAYHGDLIERVGDYTILRTSLDWIPSHSYGHKALYDMTFSYPASMVLLSLGKKVSTSTADRTTTSRWVTELPNTNNSFHIGLFKEKPLTTPDGVPKCTLYHVPTSYDFVDEIGTDIEQSLTFYTKLFGPPPITMLHATELPGTHGEAFPGLLHLSSMAFVSTADFFQEQFIAHEVAHQWWGISVKPLTYRDRWLSEGFSEYSCLMYSQLAAREGEKFFRLLDEYRKGIMSFGKKDIGKNLAPPSIALGHRVSNGAGLEFGAYNDFIYYKGAWVIHMLRNMMIDLKSMKEDAYMTVMREFYNRFKNKHASTEDFRTTVEQLTGADMKWFFDQWVYGNELPTYRVAWKKELTLEGQWKVTMRIRQQGVSESFRMPIPVKIVDEDGKAVRLRINVTSATNEVELPPFQFEPEDVVFNDLSSVLCDVKTESY
ncbi:MAG: hypothetical protein FGM33_05515 [Candidatus Kapabacteria bacterium]|nr:hypothetical protein [Candidatus Kapabacteria bacterium]